MAKLRLQFHAAPDELIALATEWAREHGLTLTLETFFPEYMAVSAAGDDAEAAAERLGGVDRVCLCPVEPDVRAVSAHDFVKRNPECLLLSIGRVTDAGLRESALSAVTDDKPSLKTWRTIMRAAKSRMRKGAWVQNPHTGHRDKVPNHLYTAGASDLSQQGVRMLAAAGWSEYVFGA